MRPSYDLEQYQIWTQVNSITFERKLVNETAFDGIIKIYILKTNSEAINKSLREKFFGEFSYPTENGVFLRMFANKESWPKTTLIHVNFKNSTVTEIDRNRSSWNIWKGKDLGNGKYSIEISPKKIIDCEIIFDSANKQITKVNGKTIAKKNWWKFWR